jgi:large subunit ribosomal protein L10
MAQQWKVDRIHSMREELKKYSNFMFIDYRGMNVQQMSGLRNNLREKGAKFHVVKNRFLKRVFSETGNDQLGRFLVNPTAIAYSKKEMTEAAKVLIAAAKESSLQIKGGFLEGSVLSTEEIDSLSRLPSRQVLIAQAVGMLNAPLGGLVTVLGGLISQFVRTLKAIEETKQ